MHMGKAGLKLLKSFESCKLKAYKGKGEENYTIGWGHCGKDVYEGQTITQKEADDMLKQDLLPREAYVRQYVNITLNQNQFDALVDYVYNRGIKGLKQLCEHSKTVEDYSKNIVIYWGSNTAVKNGILKRRLAEKELFDKPVVYNITSKKYRPESNLIIFGDTGKDVSWLQYRLISKGYGNLTLTGKFGKNTLEAVQKFQKRNNLEIDGEVGPKTIAELVK